MSSISILILADNAVEVRGYQEVISKYGSTDVRCITDPASLKNSEDRTYDVAILDSDCFSEISSNAIEKNAHLTLVILPGYESMGLFSRKTNNTLEFLIKDERYEYIKSIPFYVDRFLQRRRILNKELSDFKYALDQANIVAITDTKGIITYVNDRFCEISEYSREELLGQNHRIVNSGYHSSTFFKQMWSTISAGNKWKGLVRNRAKGGRVYWVDTLIIPFLDENSQPFQYVAIRHDITKLKETEDELARLNTLRSGILESTDYCIIATDEKGIVSYYNKGAQELFGFSDKEMVGQPFHTGVFEHADLNRFVKAREKESNVVFKNIFEAFKIMPKGSSYRSREWKIHTRANEEKSLMVTVSPLRNKGTENAGYLFVARDITNLKAAEREKEKYLELTKHQLEEISAKNKELDEFVWIVSHDLKAPLRAISNIVHWIEEDLKGIGAKELLDNLDLLKKRTYRLDGFITGLLEYSRIGREKMEVENFDLGYVLQETAATLKAGNQNVEINLPTGLQQFRGYKLLMNQVFSNLISNAIKHNDKEKVIINIKYVGYTTFHRFEVTDNGPGIPTFVREKVFQIFQTIHPKDQKESTGIGLTIVRKIITELNGRIWIDSVGINEGVKFVFIIPR